MSRELPTRFVQAALGLNLVLLAGAVAVYLVSGSQLVLAQGSDSFQDLAAGVILLLTVRVALQPRDENHPYGHHRAEPIGALITAVLAGVLAVEVAHSALTAWLAQEHPVMGLPVLAILGGKCLAKGALWFLLGRALRQQGGPALRALRVDTRNDVMATTSSLIGLGLFHAGLPQADALLAFPVALYIAWSGVELARENLGYLMGESPEPEVLEELREGAASVPGVREVRGVRAHYVGLALHVEVTVLIDGDITATEGHDIGVDVQHRVEQHPLVSEAFVHVDTEEGVPHPSA